MATGMSVFVELGVIAVLLVICCPTKIMANGGSSTIMVSEKVEVTMKTVTRVSKITTANMAEPRTMPMDAATTEVDSKESSAVVAPTPSWAASPTTNIPLIPISKPISASSMIAIGSNSRAQVAGVVHNTEKSTLALIASSGSALTRRAIGPTNTSTPDPPKTSLPVDAGSRLDLSSRSSKPLCPISQALQVDSTGIQPDGPVWHYNGSDWFCPCKIKPCLWMCCPKGQMYNSNTTCAPATDTPLYLEVEDSHKNVRKAQLMEFFLRFEEICPGKKLRLEPENYPDDNYTVFENGTLYIPLFTPPTFPPGEFCVSFINNSASYPAVMSCMSPDKPDIQTALVLYSCFMIFSLPFLAVTFLVYALLPRLQNLHGKIVMSHVAVLFIAYLSLIIVQLNSHSFADWACKFTAFIIYFAFLASFFWLNVMCLDIWWTFSGFRPMRGSVKEREHKKFIIYSLYCWGSPLIMLIIALIMDLHPGIPETYEKPGFGEKKCWFRSTIGNLIYFSGPIAILIVCNIVLFILTAFKIRQVKRGTKILKKQDSRRHNEEEENNAQRFNLYLKLFLVMGVNWIMEVISFAAGGPDEWWYVTDIMNTLQGVLIFVIFVCKRRIRRLLMERFWPERAGTMNSTNSSSTRMTAIRRNGSVMSSTRGSLKTQEGYPMKAMAASTSVRSDDSDVA